MKKISFFALGLVAFSGAANAMYQERVVTETVTVASPVSTVAQVMAMPDNTNVVVTGTIVRPLGNERYLFRDASGTMTVEIDDSNWRGLEITEYDTVKLSGQVDKGSNGTEIDVNYIQLM